MRCFYEILGVPPSSTDVEIKKAYKNLALLYHPDKNQDNQDEAKEKFQILQEAYETLIDPNERSWYDKHRDELIGGQENDGSLQKSLYDYFRSSCYDGFDDSKENNFFAVYKDVFEQIYLEDKQFSNKTFSYYPTFGSGDSNESVWMEFYNFFSVYSTPQSYTWLNKYNIKQAENRKIAKLMEKENKKLRDEAKKERNLLIKMLVKYVKKKDPRVKSYNLKLKEIAKENSLKTKMWRNKQLEERQILLDQVEKLSIENEFEDDLAALENQYNSDDELYCEICDLDFSNKKMKKSHLKSKSHEHKINNINIECE